MTVLLALATCGGGHATGPDERLSLADLQVRGTHNSYHVAPPGAVGPSERAITLPPLDAQLDSGLRQLELDVHTGPAGLRVFHQAGDEGSTCDPFAACLRLLRRWSDRHRHAVPVTVLVETKDPPAAGAPEPAELVDAAVRLAFPRSRLITPDAVQGRAPTLAAAVATRGWPRLAQARGRFTFVLLDTGAHRAAYTRGGTSLAGRSLFTYGAAGQPLTAVASVPDPVAGAARIRALVAAGVLVRTRADEGGIADPARRAAAERSGAQLISTDLPDLTRLEGPACNPVRTTPRTCVRGHLER